jgi:hypothetical protein
LVWLALGDRELRSLQDPLLARNRLAFFVEELRLNAHCCILSTGWYIASPCANQVLMGFGVGSVPHGPERGIVIVQPEDQKHLVIALTQLFAVEIQTPHGRSECESHLYFRNKTSLFCHGTAQNEQGEEQRSGPQDADWRAACGEGTASLMVWIGGRGRNRTFNLSVKSCRDHFLSSFMLFTAALNRPMKIWGSSRFQD